MVSVELPGPPRVMANTYSKTLNASNALMINATTITGRNMGNVIKEKVNHRPAPSTRAASNGVLGKASKPARNIKSMNGVHCHTSIRTIENNANSGPNQSKETPILNR